MLKLLDLRREPAQNYDMDVIDLPKWKERIHAAAKLASETPAINMSGLSSEIGWSQSGLAKFVSQKHGGDENVSALGMRLAELGFLPLEAPSQLESVTLPEDALQSLAQRLEDLTPRLRDSSRERFIRSEEIIGFVENALRTLRIEIAAAKKRGETP